jgi:hypothetical protein
LRKAVVARIGVRKSARQLLVELQVVRNDDRAGRGERLVQIARRQRQRQPLARRAREQKDEARRLRVGGGRTHLHQVVERAHVGFGHFATEGIVGAGGAEQLVEGGGIDGGHGCPG